MEPSVEIVDALLQGDTDRAIVASLVAMGADRVAVEALLAGAVSEQLLPAPDLDADGLPDVLGLARQPRPGQSSAGIAELLTVTARSGLTGAPLWSAQVPGVTGTVRESPGGPLLISIDAGGGVVTQHLTAFTRAGEVRWQRSDAGAVTFTAIQWPYYAGQLTRADGSVRHLVHAIDYSYLLDQTLEPGQITLRVLDDADGSAARLTGRVGDGVPWSWVAPDLNGDGNADLLVTQSFAFGERGDVVAMTVEGETLWSATAPFRSNGFLVLPGDVTGDGVGDLAVGADSNAVALISGRDGSTAWEKPGEWPAAVGDVDGDGVPDVGVRSIGVVDFSEFVTRHSAYDDAGARLYEEQAIIPIDSGGRGWSSTTTTYLAGTDVDGDGSPDTFHEFDLTYSDGERVTDAGATSGATGRRLWDGRLRTLLGGSVQGPGIDLADVRSNGSEAFVEILRGDTLARIWRVGVAVPGSLVDATASAVDLDGDGVGDVLVTAVTAGSNGSFVQHGYVLDGRDGSLAW
ncbi:MAG: FG-GAP repeat domain-containing protein [Nocardioidaceae bacterium]